MTTLDFKFRLETDDDWMEAGACRGLSEIFFAPLAERPQTRLRREEKARKVCLECPVLHTCREFARQHREYGFWGGESEEQRHSAGYRLIAPVGIRA
jgi:WhiB family redox-sensing transcriptional regulator